MAMMNTLTKAVMTISQRKCADCLDDMKVIGAGILKNIGNCNLIHDLVSFGRYI